MTLDQLFQKFRSDVDDTAAPFLWSDSDLEIYFNWALEELAKRARYFLDRTTWAGLTVTANDPKITATSGNYLDKILSIRRATLGSTGKSIDVKSMDQADESVPDTSDYGHWFQGMTSTHWETNTGVPRLVITDYYQDGSLRVGPVPVEADTIDLWAVRLPLRYVSFERSSALNLKELAGIKELNHELTLVEGMKVQAYLKEDPETRDTELALQSEARFQTQVLDIKRELVRKRKPVGTVRYGGL